MLDENQCWQAVIDRDAAQDGRFVYGVVTTGVYCRPSCATPRRALRRNVRFYASAEAAEADGLRPCKRCGGAESVARRIDALCRHIERHPEQRHSLADLGRRAGLSPQHLQRRFKARVGVTPREYAASCQARTLRAGLRQASSVTGASADAGFSSSSRLHDSAASHLGMTPGEYRAGGRGVRIGWASHRTALGLMLIGATDRGLCFLQFGDDEAELLQALRGEFPAAAFDAMPPAQAPAFADWMSALAAHLQGRRAAPDLPLDIQGTAFQLQVWRYLQGIAPGQVQSYSEVAAGIGRPRAVRAVASACARNRIGLLIPCHRVIRGDGGLGGYRWGLDRKRALLALERRLSAAAD